MHGSDFFNCSGLSFVTCCGLNLLYTIFSKCSSKTFARKDALHYLFICYSKIVFTYFGIGWLFIPYKKLRYIFCSKISKYIF